MSQVETARFKQVTLDGVTVSVRLSWPSAMPPPRPLPSEELSPSQNIFFEADQAIRGTVSLPHGTGKTKKVLVLCTPDKEEAAKGAGADFVGLDEFITKIEGGWTDIDVIIATPAVMPKIGKLGKVLGPRNLMPNPKTGTVTNDVANAVTDVKGGKIAFKVDKAGIVHASIGRISFAPDKLAENSTELINAIIKLKPSSSKGTYIKGVSMASTMSPGIMLDTKSLMN